MQFYHWYLIVSILAIVSLSASSEERRLRGDSNAESHYQRRLFNGVTATNALFDGATTAFKSGADDVGDDILKNVGKGGFKEGLEGAGTTASKNADALGGGHSFGNMPPPHARPHGQPYQANGFPPTGYAPPSPVATPYAPHQYPPGRFRMSKRHKLGVAAFGAGAMYLGSELGESNTKYKHTLETLEDMQEKEQEEEDEEAAEDKRETAEKKAKEARRAYREQQQQPEGYTEEQGYYQNQPPAGYAAGQGYYQDQTPGGGYQYQQSGEKPKYVVYTGPNGEPEVYYA